MIDVVLELQCLEAFALQFTDPGTYSLTTAWRWRVTFPVYSGTLRQPSRTRYASAVWVMIGLSISIRPCPSRRSGFLSLVTSTMIARMAWPRSEALRVRRSVTRLECPPSLEVPGRPLGRRCRARYCLSAREFHLGTGESPGHPHGFATVSPPRSR